MKFSLTITGSAAALAAAMEAAASVDGDPMETPLPERFTPEIVGNPSTDTGAVTPQPTPVPSVPNGAASIPTAPTPSMSPVSTITPVIPTGEVNDGSGVDAEGLPWDVRIHSSSKKKTEKGLWAARKGGPKGDELAAIKDELRGITQQPLPMHAGGTVAAPMPMPMVGEITHEQVVPAAPALTPLPIPMPAVSEPVETPVMAPLPTPVPMPVAAPEPTAPIPAPVPNPPATEEWDFAKLMAQIGPKIGSGVITTEYLIQVCQRYGIGSITDTAQKPEVIPSLVAQFQADGVW